MASALLLKRRIKTARNVSKTTRAFQMIAASRLKKAQEAAIQSKPYVEKLEYLSKGLTSRIEADSLHEYMKTNNNTATTLYIIFSPDKGLCGSLVSNLTKEVIQNSSNKNDFYIAVGKKAEHNVYSLGKNVIATFPFGTSLPHFDMVYPIAKIIEEYFLNKKVSQVKVISTRFISVFTQNPIVTNVLPIRFEEEKSSGSESTMLFEPNLSELLPSLLDHYLEMIIYQLLLENFASEQAARMVAMKNATDNAGEMIKTLQLEYNKVRQEKITGEILDITGGQFAYA